MAAWEGVPCVNATCTLSPEGQNPEKTFEVRAPPKAEVCSSGNKLWGGDDHWPAFVVMCKYLQDTLLTLGMLSSSDVELPTSSAMSFSSSSRSVIFLIHLLGRYWWRNSCKTKPKKICSSTHQPVCLPTELTSLTVCVKNRGSLPYPSPLLPGPLSSWFTNWADTDDVTHAKPNQKKIPAQLTNQSVYQQN